MAAFPPVITAHLLSTLLQNFTPAARNISTLMANFLLSPLCRPLGRGLYEIYPDIQEMLRNGLTDRALEIRLARFLDKYRLECAADIPGPAMREALRWTALSISDPEAAAREYLAAYNENRILDLKRMEAWQGMSVNPGKGAPNPYQAAVQLVRGIRRFEAGEKAGADVEKLRELKSMLQTEEGGNRIKTRVPEGLWDWLQMNNSGQKEEDTPRNEYTLKVHILFETDSDINGVMEKAFGVMGNFSGKAFESVQGTYIREKDTFHINYWVADECGLPGVTDNLWMTENGLYFVVIDYHSALPEQNSRQAVALRKLLDRFKVRLPKGTQIFLILVLTGEYNFDEKADEELKNTLRDEEIILTIDPSNPNAGIWQDFIRDTAYKAGGLTDQVRQEFANLKNLSEGIFTAGELAKRAGINLSEPDLTINNFTQLAVKSGAAISEGRLPNEVSEDILMVTGIDLFLQNLTPLFRVDQPWNAGSSTVNIDNLKGYHDPEWTAQILESYCLLHKADQGLIEIPWRVKDTYTAPIIDRKKEKVQYLTFFPEPFCEDLLFQFQAWIKKQFPYAPVHLSRNEFALELSETISELVVMVELEEMEEAFKTLQRLAGDWRLSQQQNALFGLYDKYRDNEKKLVEQKISRNYYQQVKNNVKATLNALINELPIAQFSKEILKIEGFLSQGNKTLVLQLAGNTSEPEVKYWINQFSNFQLRYFPGLTYTLTQRLIPACATPEMVIVEAGSFQMGDIFNDKEYDDEKPVHEVTLNAFSIGKYPVTMEEYDAFCEATGRKKPEDQGWGRGNRPVINVNWYDAVAYCNWLSEIWGLEPAYRISGERVELDRNTNGYRLPTEAEWEFAARAFSPSGGIGPKGGGNVRFGNGKDIADSKEINFNPSKEYKKPYSKTGEYRGRTTPVDQFLPNPLGLHDMSGNVYEWCWDWFGNYPSSPQNNPTGPDSGSRRVRRGGSWVSYPVGVRCAYRSYYAPVDGSDYLGFRLARTVTE